MHGLHIIDLAGAYKFSTNLFTDGVPLSIIYLFFRNTKTIYYVLSNKICHCLGVLSFYLRELP